MVIAIGHGLHFKTGRRGGIYCCFMFAASTFLKINPLLSHLKQICHLEIYELASFENKFQRTNVQFQIIKTKIKKPSKSIL